MPALNTNNIVSAKFGSTDLDAVYYGAEKLWPSQTPDGLELNVSGVTQTGRLYVSFKVPLPHSQKVDCENTVFRYFWEGEESTVLEGTLVPQDVAFLDPPGQNLRWYVGTVYVPYPIDRAVTIRAEVGITENDVFLKRLPAMDAHWAPPPFREEVPPPENVALQLELGSGGTYYTAASWHTHLAADKCEAEYSLDYGGTWLPCDSFPHVVAGDRHYWQDDIVHQESNMFELHYFRCRAHEQGEWSDWSYADGNAGKPLALGTSFSGASNGLVTYYGTAFVQADHTAEFQHLDPSTNEWSPSLKPPIDLYKVRIGYNDYWYYSCEISKVPESTKRYPVRVRSQNRTHDLSEWAYWRRPTTPQPFDLSLHVRSGFSIAQWKTAPSCDRCECEISSSGTTWINAVGGVSRVDETNWKSEPAMMDGNAHWFRVRSFENDTQEWSEWVIYQP